MREALHWVILQQYHRKIHLTLPSIFKEASPKFPFLLQVSRKVVSLIHLRAHNHQQQLQWALLYAKFWPCIFHIYLFPNWERCFWFWNRFRRLLKWHSKNNNRRYCPAKCLRAIFYRLQIKRFLLYLEFSSMWPLFSNLQYFQEMIYLVEIQDL